MPLLTHMIAGAASHTVSIFANVYHDPVANTLEFGARVYSTPEAARERALSRPIRENLTYLGPVPIASVVPQEFITAGIAADAERFRRVREEAAAARREAEEAERAERDEASFAADDADPNPALPCRETLSERDGVAPSTHPEVPPAPGVY